MSIIKTRLANNLRTNSRVDARAQEVETAFNNPREVLNPGELLCAALGACMMTMVGFLSSKRGENMVGTEVYIEPDFDDKHSKITGLSVTFAFPASATKEQKEFYSQAAQTCPVHNSLRSDIVYRIQVK